MKMKKIIPFLFTSLALTSCGSDKYAGRYSFQMGKDDGTHFGIAVKLGTEKFVTEEGTELGKKFEITLSTNAFQEIFGKDELELEGGYTIGDVIDEKNQTYLVDLHFEVLDIIAQFLIGDTSEKSDNYLQKLLTTEVDNKAFYFTIPVSMDDLFLQLYWYGLDVCYNEVADQGPKEVTQHPLHSHPTEADIQAINNGEEFQNSHKNDDGEPFVFRDYHPIKIGLTRDDKK